MLPAQSVAHTRLTRTTEAPPGFTAPRAIDLHHTSRDEIHAYFDATWALNELLFSSIRDPRDLYRAPDALRRPLIFYWGHTAAFYVNKLQLAGIRERGLDPRLDELFARGVDPAKAGDLDSIDAWPSLEVTNDYRRRVQSIVRDTIDQLDWEAPISSRDPRWALLMGFEHGRIHFETSSVLFRQMPVETVRRPVGWEYACTASAPPSERFVSLPAGSVTVGAGTQDSARLFGWDNEFGQDTREVAAFETSQHLVSNGLFRAFVEAGGYARREYWSDAGWAWRQEAAATRPKFWVDGGRNLRLMFDEVPMPDAFPAEVNAHEAAAYCRYRGVRLPTEAEWKRMADVSGCCADPMGAEELLHFAAGSPRAVDAGESRPSSSTEAPLHDVRGNVWQWLSDDFHPLPGFETHPLYKDFSQPYFDSDHAMLRGGCWATTGTGASVYYRLWFRRHFFQHAGFRVVRDVNASTPSQP